MKIFIRKTGTPEYHYNVLCNNIAWYPLQYGSGQYMITLYKEDTPGSSKYIKIQEETVNTDMSDPDIVFLQSNVNMNWDKQMKCIKHAGKLASWGTDDISKVFLTWR